MAGPAPQTVGPGPNDAAMLEPDNWWSNAFNTGVGYVMGKGGYNTQRRGQQGDGDATGGAPGDNSFYRDNASWMPGWGNTFGLGFLDPHGLPSGATAQDRATNYVGHDDPTGVWTSVRRNLVTNESAAIDAARARGEDHISFGDVYGAHVSAYSDAQATAREQNPASQAGNTFIDPASFALAVYGAPLMEHLGINAGPITGASIDMFNDPTDSVGDGWAKRMGLAAGEIGAGAGMGLHGLMTGNPLEMLGGAAMTGVGVFSGVWNTATAIGNGMSLGDAASGIGHVASSGARAIGSMASDAWHGAGNAISGAGSAISGAWDSLWD